MEQNTLEWLEHRKNYVGASDAPIIMGLSPWKTPYQLYEEKISNEVDMSPPSASAERGKMMEPIARSEYEKYTGISVSPAMVYHPEILYMSASLDGISEDKKRAVEIKNVKAEYHDLAKNGKVPEIYYPQLQHQLAILFALYGIGVLDYYSYRNGEGALVEVGIDEKYLKKLCKEEGAFWNNNVLLRNPPELSDGDYVSFEGDEEWVKMSEKYLRLEESIKQLEVNKEIYKQWFVDRSNEKSARGGGIRLRRTRKKGSIDYKAIPEIQQIDTEKYRKKSVEYWSIGKT